MCFRRSVSLSITFRVYQFLQTRLSVLAVRFGCPGAILYQHITRDKTWSDFLQNDNKTKPIQYIKQYKQGTVVQILKFVKVLYYTPCRLQYKCVHPQNNNLNSNITLFLPVFKLFTGPFKLMIIMPESRKAREEHIEICIWSSKHNNLWLDKSKYSKW